MNNVVSCSTGDALEEALRQARPLSAVMMLCVFQEGRDAFTVRIKRAEPVGAHWVIQGLGNESGLSRAGLAKVLKKHSTPAPKLQTLIFLHRKSGPDNPSEWSLRDERLQLKKSDGDSVVRVEYKLPDQKRP